MAFAHTQVGQQKGQRFAGHGATPVGMQNQLVWDNTSVWHSYRLISCSAKIG